MQERYRKTIYILVISLVMISLAIFLSIRNSGLIPPQNRERNLLKSAGEGVRTLPTEKVHMDYSFKKSRNLYPDERSEDKQNKAILKPTLIRGKVVDAYDKPVHFGPLMSLLKPNGESIVTWIPFISQSDEFEFDIGYLFNGTGGVILQFEWWDADMSSFPSLEKPSEIVKVKFNLNRGQVHNLGVIRFKEACSWPIIQGYVYDNTGNPVSSYNVDYDSIIRAKKSQFISQIQTLYLEKEGKFLALVNSEENYNFCISAEGFAPKVIKDIKVRRSDTNKVLHIYLDHGADLFGIVKSDQGYPVEKAKLTLSSDIHDLTAETDPLGFFRLEHISQEMDYALKVEHPDYETLEKEFKQEYFKYNLNSQHEFILQRK